MTNLEASWGRAVLVTLAVGATVLVLAGGGSYTITRVALTPEGTTPVSCDGDRLRCVPDLPIGTVVAGLSERGFTCEQNPASDFASPSTERHHCDLIFGTGHYQAIISGRDGLISDYSASLSYDPIMPRPSSAEDFFRWTAEIPFGADPPAAEVTRQWLHDGLEVLEDQTATIRGFDYRLEVEQPGIIRLFLSGGFG